MNASHVGVSQPPVAPWNYRYAGGNDSSSVDHPVPGADDFGGNDSSSVDHPVPGGDDFAGNDSSSVDHPVPGSEDFAKKPAAPEPGKK